MVKTGNERKKEKGNKNDKKVSEGLKTQTKHGIIAIVLAVGLVIILAVVLFVTLKGQTELIAKKGAKEFTANEEAGVSFSASSCTDGNPLKLKIRNTGSMKIDGFWVAPKETGATQLSVFNLKAGKEDTLRINQVGGNQEVDLYPVLIQKNVVKTGSRKKVTVIC